MTPVAAAAPVRPAPSETLSGPLAFARFALPPNLLGYCGTEDHDALAGLASAGLDGDDLVELCRSFEGAWPYLELIAHGSGVPDPLDPRVVEAYWVGNGLLDRVTERAFHEDLVRRFRGRTDRREWPWLADKPRTGAVPHHSFHVLEVMPRIGMLRAGQVQAILPAMAECIVRPARVVAAADDGALLAESRPLRMVDGRYELGPLTGLRVQRSWAGERSGDAIAVHWGRSCGPLTQPQAARLEHQLRAAIARANATV
jgi:uncharacterized protein DUF6390